VVRVVESQEQVATNRLVDDLHEQELLENLLEQTKPDLVHTKTSLHYLLRTPFRYPPLRHGSRFGKHTEPGLFYGSHTISTALAETAYYRLLFWYGMSTPPACGKFTTQHTVFATRYRTTSGLRLQAPPFNGYCEQLRHPASYQATQALGHAMREHGIKAFETISARDRKQGINVGLFDVTALSGNRPLYQQAWLCETSAEQVSFLNTGDRQIHAYSLESFLYNGSLPDPAI